MVDSLLRVAEIGIALGPVDPRVNWEWKPPVSAFLAGGGAADLVLDVGVFASPPSGGPVVFDSGAVWRLVRSEGRSIFECRSVDFGPAPYKIAIIDEDFARGSLLVREDVAPLGLNPLDYPLDEVLFAHLLGRGRGVELHSCGIIDSRGRGHLFVGVSGAGKSTTARLWGDRAAAIVSDDRVIVRERDGAMWIHGTPWHGEAELSAPRDAPLCGIYLLEQAASNALRELEPAQAVARLFGCAFPPFHDASALAFTLGFLERIAGAVPVRELRFTRDGGAVDLVLESAA